MRFPAVLMLLATAFLVPACSGTPKEPPPGQVKANLTDVPAPEGLSYDEGYGHAAEGVGIRNYTQKYSGSRRVEDLVAFYEKVLPVHGWTPKSKDGTDPVKLVFEKRAEACTVEISSTAQTTTVNVKLDAKK